MKLLRSLRRRWEKAIVRLRTRELAPGVALFDYGADRDAAYRTYRATQEAGNKRKLHKQWVQEPHVAFLADYVTRRLGPVRFGLCHGTRRGGEQAWFRARLPGAPTVIGTEISETAGQFPDTIQWDFHDLKDEWVGAADFVYSNSWDHAFDPARAFRNWALSLRPGGLMLLDHCSNVAATEGKTDLSILDPFAADLDSLARWLDATLGDLGRVEEILDTEGRTMGRPYRVLVFRRRA